MILVALMMLKEWVLKKLPEIIVFIIFLIIMAFALYTLKKKQKAELNRLNNNVSELIKEPSSNSQNIDTKDIGEFISYTMDSILKANSIKVKNVERIHEIHSYSTHIDTSYVQFSRDTTHTLNMTQGCVTLHQIFRNDSVLTEITNNTRIGIVDYREKPKNWFWKFKWDRSKWPVNTKIYNMCDTQQVYQFNRVVKKDKKH